MLKQVQIRIITADACQPITRPEYCGNQRSYLQISFSHRYLSLVKVQVHFSIFFPTVLILDLSFLLRILILNYSSLSALDLTWHCVFMGISLQMVGYKEQWVSGHLLE